MNKPHKRTRFASIGALLCCLAALGLLSHVSRAQAAEQQTGVSISVATSGDYVMNGDQSAATVKKLAEQIEIAYVSPERLPLVCRVPFGGRIHLDRLKNGARIVNIGGTPINAELADTAIEMNSGTSVEIVSDGKNMTIRHTSDRVVIAARAAADAFAAQHAERVPNIDADVKTHIVNTFQDAFWQALRAEKSPKQAVEQAAAQLVDVDAAASARAATAQIVQAVKHTTDAPLVVTVAGRPLKLNAVSAAIPLPQPIKTVAATLEPGSKGAVLADTGFRPAAHGFGFANYGGEYPHGDLTAEETRRLFGDDACIGQNDGKCQLSPAAYLWLSRFNRALMAGHGEGMAVLSALFFTGQAQPQTYGGATTILLRPSNPALLRQIAMYSAMQMFAPTLTDAAQSRAKTPSEIAAVLLAALKKGEFMTLGIYDATGGQTLLPYAVEDAGNGLLWIHVYDPNFPEQGRYVEIDQPRNRWKYAGQAGETGSLDAVAVALRQQAIRSPFAADASSVALLISGDASGVLSNTIPNTQISRLRGLRTSFSETSDTTPQSMPILVSLPKRQHFAMQIQGQEFAASLRSAVSSNDALSKGAESTEGEDALSKGAESAEGEDALSKGAESNEGEDALSKGAESTEGEDALSKGAESAEGEDALSKGAESAEGEDALSKGAESAEGEDALSKGAESAEGEDALSKGAESAEGEDALSRGAVNEIQDKPLWALMFSTNSALLLDNIKPAPLRAEEMLLHQDGRLTYRAGQAQQMTFAAGTQIDFQNNSRYTLRKVSLSAGHALTIAVNPTSGDFAFTHTDPTLETVELIIRQEDGKTSRRYGYDRVNASATEQNLVNLHTDGRFSIGRDTDGDGVANETSVADADADGIPDGADTSDGDQGIVPGAQGILVADTGFRPAVNGFGFPNYAKNQYSYGDLTTQDAWRMFGDQACELVKNGQCIPAPATELWVKKMNQAMQRGHCEGMAVLSMWLYANQIEIEDARGKQAADLDPSYERLLREIAYYWTTQTLEPVKSSFQAFRKHTPTELLHVVIDAMTTGKETYTVGIYGKGGHAVTPYAVEDVKNGLFWIHIYDNNYPGVGKYIEIDTVTDTWTYAGAALNPTDDPNPWSGGAGTMDLTPSSVRRQPFACTFCKSKTGGATKTVNILIDGDGIQVAAATPDGKKITMQNGQVSNQIPGAQMTSMKGDDERQDAVKSPIFGTDRSTMLTLPAGADYAISLTSNNPNASPAWVGVMREGVMFAIDDIRIGDAQTDTISIDRDGQIGYQSEKKQTPTLSVATNTPGKPDGTYVMSGSAFGPNGEIKMKIDPNTGNVAFAPNDPSVKTLNISVTTVNGEESRTLDYKNIEIEPGEQFVAVLDENGELTVGIDEDGDGLPETTFAASETAQEEPVAEATDEEEEIDAGYTGSDNTATTEPENTSEETQDMAAEFQGLTEDATSAAGTDSSDSATDIDIPEAATEPQTVNVPVTIISK